MREITKDQAIGNAKEHMVEAYRKYVYEQLGELKIMDSLPSNFTTYGVPDKDCWYILTNMFTRYYNIDKLIDSPMRLICVSKKTGKVVYDGEVR